MKIIWIENSLLRITVFNMNKTKEGKDISQDTPPVPKILCVTNLRAIVVCVFLIKYHSCALKSRGSYGNSGLFLQRSQ